MSRPTRLVVVGNGMVGQRFVELAAARGPDVWDITVLGAEPRPAYDRVALSSWFEEATEEDLNLVPDGFYDGEGPELVCGDAVTAVDRDSRSVETESGRRITYDHLVFATGSDPFVPPVKGNDLPGCFVYRTIEDLESISAHAAGDSVRSGVVIGGGLLGLEAANALRSLGELDHVHLEAERLMPQQLDAGAATMLRHRIEDLGVAVHTGHATTEITADGRGRVARLSFEHDDHDDLDAQMVVFSAGIRPADALASACGLATGDRGGIVVDEWMRTSDPAISAVGECALAAGRLWGLVAPGYAMARTLDSVLADEFGGSPVDATGTSAHREGKDGFVGGDLSTKLKLLGIDVASFGDAFATGEGHHELVWNDPSTRTYRKLVVEARSGAVVGGMLVGDASGYPELTAMARGDLPTPTPPAALLPPSDASAGAPAVDAGALGDSATICSCENVDAGTIRAAIANGATDIGALKSCTRAGTGCGGCIPQATSLLHSELRAAGVEVNDDLCEHFQHNRRDLFALVRMHRHSCFAEVISAHGSGAGCEVCKPTVASILASLSNGHILDGDQAALQDTNDHFLANMQRDGTYSVVPRVPGGEITPEGLITIGEVARDYGLYTKITGGQRIDLFGARVEQLPPIWKRLVEAGFESGHAYGKALRTVKSCVGETWCRYGVQDSTSMAIALELRYRGLRSPHKVKMAVSGCARECAEAQSKDIGVIATDRGWNLYVAGNGGKTPRHAELLATDLDDESLVRLVDRFLFLYIRTADRLERTSVWFDKLEGSVEERLDWLRRVLVEDELGICAELDADMGRHVESYSCEWRDTLADPERLSRFVTFVNAPDATDPTVVFVQERNQIRPARPGEIDDGVPVAIELDAS